MEVRFPIASYLRLKIGISGSFLSSARHKENISKTGWPGVSIQFTVCEQKGWLFNDRLLSLWYDPMGITPWTNRVEANGQINRIRQGSSARRMVSVRGENVG